MARKTVRVSDHSGAEIPDGKGATVRITFADARKGVRELDLTDAEAERLGGRAVARRGRRPVSFHDLRHAFASRCASRGVAVGTLSAVMGHANVGITQGVYTHLYGRQEAEQAFRQAMSGAEVGNSLATRDGNQPGTAENPPEVTSAFQS
jgi:integrase